MFKDPSKSTAVMSVFSQNTETNDLTKEKNRGQEQHSPNFPARGEILQKHEARLARLAPKPLRFTSNKADSAATNRKQERIAHSMQTQLCHGGKVTVSFGVNAAETPAANFTCEPPTLTPS